jgi:ATP-dependent RNA helicase DDX24/MAK5
MNFLSPTPIQAEAIPFALAGRDVVGVAETVRSLSPHLVHFGVDVLVVQGSGKTLAYGLPILHHLLSQPRPPDSRRSLKALILAPTRELALQVSSHLNACLGPPDEVKASRKDPPLVSIAALVGGMSQQKQRRILQRGVDVLVATPGRLWDTMDDVGSSYRTYSAG